MAREEKKVLRSLEELKGISLVPLPELPEIELLPTEELELRAEKIREGAEKIREWTSSTLTKLEEVAKGSREARELMTKQITEAQRGFKEFLSHETPAYRRAAWLGFLQFEFSRELHTHQEVENLLERLVKEGYLQEDPTGTLKAYSKIYAISAEATFGKSEVAEVRKVLADLLSRVWREEIARRKETAQELLAQGQFSRKELLAGKTGKYSRSLPPEKYFQNGQEMWRAGGVILVESDGKKVFPLGASGGIAQPIQEAADLGVHLLVESLTWDTPPFIRELELEKAKKVQLLWHLLKRAMRAEAEKEKLDSLRQELGAKAPITPQEWFLERKPGTTLAEFEGTWEVKSPQGEIISSVPNFFFLVERKEEEGTKRIHIVEVPDHLGDFFAQNMGEYPEEGEKFEGVPYPLRVVLQAIYGQVSKSAQINSAQK